VLWSSLSVYDCMLAMLSVLDVNVGEHIPRSKPSILTFPKGFISDDSPVPPPKRFQSWVANVPACNVLERAVVASAPPRLSKTFFPRPWQVVMS